MSHANGMVLLPDGRVKHFEYDGTTDIALPWLYDTYKEMHDNWRNKERKWPDYIGKPEPIEAWTSYGEGFIFAAKYYKDSNCIGWNNNSGEMWTHNIRPEWVVNEYKKGEQTNEL